ncbi:MAG TPA: hypothetical protein PL000_16750, partial [Anaerolineales bacterium]|nr:hypothetical protein [Anaerolineales bacterium]
FCISPQDSVIIAAMENKTYSKLFVAGFFLLLVAQLFGPKLTLKTISERFLFRLPLIQNFNSLRYTLGDQVFNEGIVGKDGWLFYSGDFSIHDYQKTSPVSKKNLKEVEAILNQLNDAAMRSGGSLLVVIPPDKNTIYPQYMPDEIPVLGEVSRLEQFMQYMQEHTNIQIMDLRPVLSEASQSTQVYFKSDAHWNCLGAYYASAEIMSLISISHPEVRPRPLSDFEIGTMVDSTLDISKTMGLGLQEETWVLTPKFETHVEVMPAPFAENKQMRVSENSQTDLPTAVILHDSFYNECLNQLLEPYFSKTYSLHYGTSKLSDYVGLIEKEKPDVVIVEFAERHIEYFFKLLTE